MFTILDYGRVPNVHFHFNLPSVLSFISLALLPSALSELPPAAMFLLCAVKVSDAVTEMMMAEFHHQEACQRINSVLKFYTLWRFRYQVWPRMEEGAQQIFKVMTASHLYLSAQSRFCLR